MPLILSHVSIGCSIISLSACLVFRTFHLSYCCMHLHSNTPPGLSLSHTHTPHTHTVLCPICVRLHFPCVEKSVVARIFLFSHFLPSILVVVCPGQAFRVARRIRSFRYSVQNALKAIQSDKRYEVNRAHTFTCALFKPCNHAG